MKLVTWACATALACGGQIADDDSGTESKDASTQGDAATIGLDASVGVDAKLLPDGTTTTCGGGDVSSDETDGGCQIAMTYACGSTNYSIQCDCPSATCTCSMQSTGESTVAKVSASPDVCPTCSLTPDDVGTICGFPH